MKRLVSVILLLVITFFTSSMVNAASGTIYRLEELEMSIDLPSEYVVFTRDTVENDSNLAAYGLEKKDLSDLMESQNIYLDAWDQNVDYEILVTMTENTISNFNLLSDTTLTVLASSLQTEYAKNGVTVEQYEIYQHEQAKFIKIYFEQLIDTDTAYGLQCYTIYDNKAINITLQTLSGKIDTSKESEFMTIIDTVRFDQEPVIAESTPDTDAFLYVDKEAGVEFTVPANWVQKSLSKDRETIDAKFVSNEEPGLSILYGSIDIWSKMSSDEQRGSTRSDIDNSISTSDDLAEAIGITGSAVSTVIYNGKEYSKFSATYESSDYRIGLKVMTICLMRIENGYAYIFQFSGDENNSYYGDFESLLKSVKYPAVENSGASNTNSRRNTARILLNLILSLLITVSIYSIPIVIYRFCIVKKPVTKSKAKKITVIYGVSAFIVMSVLIFIINGSGAAGASILVWSGVNYKVLTAGMGKSAGKTVIYRRRCGFMGLVADIGAMKKIQRIKNGGSASISISSITTMIINLSDANRTLSSDDFNKIYAVYEEMRKCKTPIKMDINGYYETAVSILSVCFRSPKR